MKCHDNTGFYYLNVTLCPNYSTKWDSHSNCRMWKWINPHFPLLYSTNSIKDKQFYNEDKWSEKKKPTLICFYQNCLFKMKAACWDGMVLSSPAVLLGSTACHFRPRFHPFHVKILSPLNGEFNEGENVSTLFFIMRENFNQRISFLK